MGRGGKAVRENGQTPGPTRKGGEKCIIAGFTASWVPFGLHPIQTHQAQPKLVGWRMANHEVGVLPPRLPFGPSSLSRLLCPLLTSVLRSGRLAAPPVANPRHSNRSPEVSSAAFRAQPSDLRFALLMDMGFAVSCPLAPRSRLESGSCTSAHAFAPRFLQTPPHDDALALR